VAGGCRHVQRHARARPEDPSQGTAISRVFAETGHLELGDSFSAQMADKSHRTFTVAAIYERAAGLGDVLVDDAPAPLSAVFVNGSRPHPHRSGVQVLTRDEYKQTLHTSGNESAWGVWLIIGLSALFTALALINTAAMATAERRAELATIRLLGGTSGHAIRTVALETLPTVLVALGAGAAIVAISVHGVPDGLTGIPLTIPLTLVAGISAGAAALGLLAALVSTRLALRATPAEAMRER
jgi:putative ABC transport system permease protein